MITLKTYEDIDLLVESDTLALRDYAWEVTRALNSILSPLPDMSILHLPE